MALVGTYRCQARPLYGCLLIEDPSVLNREEPDFHQALRDAYEAIIGASPLRVAIKAGQEAVAIAVGIQVWDAAPGEAPAGVWEGQRVLRVGFPRGALIVESIAAGPIPLQPTGSERLTLPAGPGAYFVKAWHRGRERAAAAVHELGRDQAGPARYAELAGVEEYLLQIWPAGVRVPAPRR